MPEEVKNLVVEQYTDEAQIWWDAWNIAEPGAANPVAVARTLFKASAFLNHRIGTEATKKHPALRVIAGQLAHLYRVDSIGPSEEDLGKTQHEYTMQRLQRAGHIDICPVCQSSSDIPCKERPSGEFMSSDHAGRPSTMARDYASYEAPHA
jgi:hypothetical protein